MSFDKLHVVSFFILNYACFMEALRKMFLLLLFRIITKKKGCSSGL
ncbi:unnamed protein product [Brugia timori]|uniref:Uncharacterized protein n=1 Tax=Brugia timori TaxID=42155 RepID=A0A0R3R700_9BILA|nr:unnamed protein product [Brugia timori]